MTPEGETVLEVTAGSVFGMPLQPVSTDGLQLTAALVILRGTDPRGRDCVRVIPTAGVTGTDAMRMAMRAYQELRRPSGG
jgi:hypothetical protein